MHLIAPLAAGIADAPNGSVSIYRRGTSTRATYYEDFEATSAVVPTGRVLLDASGRLIAYVDELVTCEVYDSDGASVCEFVAGAQATAVEVRSEAFTGVSYETGASAVENPVTLDDVLDLWETNAGAPDWKVSFAGANTTLLDILSNLQGLVYNVKNTTYGAEGDGVVDDTAAINAAIDAAAAAGGGVVFFPEGTYRTTSALTLNDKVSLWGSGMGCTEISLDHATAHVITTAGSTLRQQYITGLTLGHAQTCTGRVLNIAAGTRLVVRECKIGVGEDSAGIGLYVAAGSTTEVRVTHSIFDWSSAATSTAVSCDVAIRRVWLEGCRFAMPASPAATGGVVTGTNVTAVGCVFDNAAMTGGTFYGYTPGANGIDALFEGCIFESTGGGAFTAYALGAYSTTAVFSESGSEFGSSGVTAYNYTASSTPGAHISLHSRTHRVLAASNSAATYTAPVKQYGIIRIRSTRAGNTTLSIDGAPPIGSTGQITIENDDASNRDFVLDTVLSGAPGFFTGGVKTIDATDGNAMTYWVTQFQIASDSDYLVLVNTWMF